VILLSCRPQPLPTTAAPYTQLLLRKARSHRIVLDHVGLDPTFADTIVGFHAQQAIEKLIKAGSPTARSSPIGRHPQTTEPNPSICRGSPKRAREDSNL